MGVVAPPTGHADVMAAAAAPLLTGARPSATRLPFPISDRVSASVDVGTGNLLITSTELVLPGIDRDVQLGLTYNSLLLGTGSVLPSGAAGPGWAMRLGHDTKLVVNSDESVLYLAPEGRQGLFQQASATTYTSPTGFKVSMVKTSTGWKVTDHASNAVTTFGSTGRLDRITDRNGQATTFAYDSAGLLTQITSTRGGAGARTANLTWSGGKLATIVQTGDEGTLRTSTYTYTAGRLTTIDDPTSRSVRPDYDSAGDLTSITDEDGHVTSFDYDSAHRVTRVTRQTPSGDAVTRFTYYTSTQTYVAGPNNTEPVGGPQTTYTLNSGELVTKAVDPLGRTRERTYTPFSDVATTKNGVGGTTAFGHDPSVNGGESLTDLASPTGATASISYANTGAAKFLPSGGSDTQGNSRLFTYDGAGNQLNSANSPAGTTSKVAYNADGTLDTSTDPRGNVIDYTAAADHQVTSVIPAAGSTLRTSTMSYDGFGRLYSTYTGAGLSTIYNYDRADRVKTIKFTDATPEVAFTHDGRGNVLTRTDTSGTTTFTYDPQNRLTSRTSAAGGGTLSYGYDKAGNLTSLADAQGTVGYTYDAANQVTSMTAANGQKTTFGYDNDGRRSDTWFNHDPGLTTFAAHTKTSFDGSGRISRTWTSRNSGDGTRTFDVSYCYSPYVAGQPCPSASASTDSGMIRWSVDNLTTARSTYTYDSSNRLTDVTNLGGHTYAYTYDKASNRTSVKVDGAITQTLTYNSGNQISNTGYNHDKLGNRTADPAQGAFSYNAAGQMKIRTNGTVSSTYTWAGPDQGELVSKVTGADTTGYVYGRIDANGVPSIRSFTKNNQHSYIDRDPTGSPVALHRPDGTTHYYALDNQGSPVNLIDSAGAVTATYSYDPTGRQLNATGSASAANPLRYAQGLLDETTGQLKHGVRWHDPGTGNWTTLDPVSPVLEPDIASRYAYVGGNPVNRLDPTGRNIDPSEACIIGATTGAIGGAVAGAAAGAGLFSVPGAIGGAAFGFSGGCVAGIAGYWLEQKFDED